MLSPDLTAAIKSQQRVATFIWLAMAFSVLIYGVVLFAMQQQGILSDFAAQNPGFRDTYAVLYHFAGIVVLLLAVLNVIMSRLLMSDNRIRKTLGKLASAETLANLKGRTVNNRLLTMLQALAPEELQLFALVPAYFSSMVIRLALAETIAIFGFILALLGGDPAIILPFAGLTLVLMAVAFPRIGAYIERGEREQMLMSPRSPDF